jgi:hypothetical protein
LRIAVVTGALGVPRDCRGLDAIVSSVPAGFRCRSSLPVIDRFDAYRLGAVAIWTGAAGLSIEAANERRGERPWVPRRRRPANPAEG